MSLQVFTGLRILAAVAAGAAACLFATAFAGASEFKPGATFKDCEHCPVMVVVPSGTFIMGSSTAETAREKVPPRDAGWERPRHPVRIQRPFAIATVPTTEGSWNACLAAGGCNGYRPLGVWSDKTPDLSVRTVSWNDAQAYVAWLNSLVSKSGERGRYSLPSEAQWEYAARAGTQTARWWGDQRADFQAKVAAWPYSVWEKTGEYPANPFGIRYLFDPELEWTADCWMADYANAPRDGASQSHGNCRERVVRGGVDGYLPARAARRSWRWIALRHWDIGFRVVRSLP
jgi:formylglycine-generating enzyme required for sulfatase activity